MRDLRERILYLAEEVEAESERARLADQAIDHPRLQSWGNRILSLAAEFYPANSVQTENVNRLLMRLQRSVYGGGWTNMKAALDALAVESDGTGTLRPEAEQGPAVPTETIRPEEVFVIHGRQKLTDFHAFLRSIGIKPLEWIQARTLTGKPNPYTWEIVDTALKTAGAIVVLMTGDDEAQLCRDLWSAGENALEKNPLRQPRQNVLFEAGVAYGRRPDRTVLVRVGDQRPMSDLAGHHILQQSNSPASRQNVANALRAAGCEIDVSGADWYQAGNFGEYT